MHWERMASPIWKKIGETHKKIHELGKKAYHAIAHENYDEGRRLYNEMQSLYKELQGDIEKILDIRVKGDMAEFRKQMAQYLG